MGCHYREYAFNYKVLQGDTEISTMPFGKNQNLDTGVLNKVEYKVINDSIVTSIYVGAFAGCPGTQIVPKIKSEDAKLILSFAITKDFSSEDCLLNMIQLNFAVKNNNYTGVYYVSPKSDRPN